MKQIGKYIVKGLLGRGGMAKVFRVEVPVIARTAALKRLDPDPLVADLVGEDRIRDLFQKEAVTMAQLRHVNLAAVWDFDEDRRGRPFYVMEYYFNNLGHMIGETARPDRPSRIIRIEKAVDYTHQVLSGLTRLHYAGIIHRDIKPFNLLITEQDTVKICDFGLSKTRAEQMAGPPNLKVGSAWYAPPEQERAPDAVDGTADLYALGVTLYRMLCGRLPADGAPPPSAVNPDLDDGWDAFLKKAMSPVPADRFQEPPAMQAALSDLFQKWLRRMDRFCRLPEAAAEPAGAASDRCILRHHPVKVDPRRARSLFGTDELWRPLRYCRNRFQPPTGGTVTDETTALQWQQGGSPFPITWRQAHRYVETVNQQRLAGRSDWRLPTIDELMSMLQKTPHGQDHCAAPVFERTQKWLWSCDRRSYVDAWYVSVELGFVAWQAFSAHYYVRAVRGGGERIQPLAG